MANEEVLEKNDLISKKFSIRSYNRELLTNVTSNRHRTGHNPLIEATVLQWKIEPKPYVDKIPIRQAMLITQDIIPRSLGSQTSPMYEYAGPSLNPKPKPIVIVDKYNMLTELAYHSNIQPKILGTQARTTQDFFP